MKNTNMTAKNIETGIDTMKLGRWFITAAAALMLALYFTGCSHEKAKNHAKESAAKFWQDKAYPGKAYDVSVIEAEDAGDGKYRVKGIVDGETRVGVFNPDTETFSEGYYSLAKERDKRIAELEQEVKYWKEKAEGLEKENYKFKVKMGIDADAKPVKKKAEKAAEAPSTEE